MAAPGEVLQPSQPFVGTSLTVGDFWAWAFSDLQNNIVRGVLAEYLVTRALDGTTAVRSAWDDFDVLTPTGLTVEVKSTGRLQSWSKNGPSAIRFSGLTGRRLSEDRRSYVGDRELRADVFVFAVHTCVDPDAYAPLDPSQWEFFVASAEAVRAVNTRSVGATFLRTSCTGPHRWDELRAAVAPFEATG